MLKNMGYNKVDCQTLVAQMRKFDLKQVPFDLPYAENYDTPLIWWMTCKSFPNLLETIAIRIFGMTPHSASCERLFSTLGWFMSTHRTNLSISRLEAMAKIQRFCISEMQNELRYTGEKMSVEEITRLLTDSINDELDEEENEEDVDINLEEDLETVIDVGLNITATLDLNAINFNNNSGNTNFNENNNQDEAVNLESEDFDLEDLVDESLRDFE
jgi:hypothetical protein